MRKISVEYIYIFFFFKSSDIYALIAKLAFNAHEQNAHL